MRRYLSVDLKRVRRRTTEFRSLATDPWIKANSEIEAQRLHALGVITFRWNLSEDKLFGLFATLLDCPESEYMALGHELNDIDFIIRIKALAANRLKDDAPLRSAISNALDVFEICRQNRNQLNHFGLVIGGVGGWDFQRLDRNPYKRVRLPFPNKAKDIRRVAKDIRRLNVTLRAIMDQVHFKFHPGRGRPPVPLPKTLPAPEFLWKPPRPSRKERARPSRSSQASGTA